MLNTIIPAAAVNTNTFTNNLLGQVIGYVAPVVMIVFIFLLVKDVAAYKTKGTGAFKSIIVDIAVIALLIGVMFLTLDWSSIGQFFQDNSGVVGKVSHDVVNSVNNVGK